MRTHAGHLLPERMTAAPMRRSLWSRLGRALTSQDSPAFCMVTARDSGAHHVYRPARNLARHALPTAIEEAAAGSEAPTTVGGQYPFREIEARWQSYWEEHATFRTPDVVDTSKPKFYALDMFPYPRRVQNISALGATPHRARVCVVP